MKQYLLSVYQPEGRPDQDVLDRIGRDLDALNARMRDAGVWVFAGGLHSPSTATVLKAGDEDVLVTDGPFVEAKEFLGGFTIVEVADLDAALLWGGRLARVLEPLSIEVRPFR
jgi:hypothetical protein